ACPFLSLEKTTTSISTCRLVEKENRGKMKSIDLIHGHTTMLQSIGVHSRKVLGPLGVALAVIGERGKRFERDGT
ncbi:unnamed protein product, partial [Ilex paraguariensis]